MKHAARRTPDQVVRVNCATIADDLRLAADSIAELTFGDGDHQARLRALLAIESQLATARGRLMATLCVERMR